ncbi:hypothetical protein CVT24_011917 [Panaeolus cyanescens]|uniref:Uncharacterized protein n=1 Tax=Panaeolus cyanescens TaxID=181874 RepID=A0A409X9V5_9AGAR|nr:hypothetical protein CVT24_011917 [Panaeolus cyanescens]
MDVVPGPNPGDVVPGPNPGIAVQPVVQPPLVDGDHTIADPGAEAYVTMNAPHLLPAFHLLQDEGYTSAQRISAYDRLTHGFRVTEQDRLAARGARGQNPIPSIDILSAFMMLVKFYKVGTGNH